MSGRPSTGSRRALWAIALAPVVFWAGSVWLAETHETTFFSLTTEDGLIENA